ncbi:hypothetical protein DL93DRAFT_1091021 [Clavulina sp. PMI_390]|nr:hypothetical protein DL93DRAFT_1091021 [Clavulina sp. PMI_390]
MKRDERVRKVWDGPWGLGYIIQIAGDERTLGKVSKGNDAERTIEVDGEERGGSMRLAPHLSRCGEGLLDNDSLQRVFHIQRAARLRLSNPGNIKDVYCVQQQARKHIASIEVLGSARTKEKTGFVGGNINLINTSEISDGFASTQEVPDQTELQRAYTGGVSHTASPQPRGGSHTTAFTIIGIPTINYAIFGRTRVSVINCHQGFF